jgi:hypothetical protein
MPSRGPRGGKGGHRVQEPAPRGEGGAGGALHHKGWQQGRDYEASHRRGAIGEGGGLHRGGDL